jgi:hypothetical protein
MNKTVLGDLANQTVSELGWDQRRVVSLEASAQCLLGGLSG